MIDGPAHAAKVLRNANPSALGVGLLLLRVTVVPGLAVEEVAASLVGASLVRVSLSAHVRCSRCPPFNQRMLRLDVLSRL